MVFWKDIGKKKSIQMKGGITRLKQHIAHMKGHVSAIGRVTTVVRESMMKLLLDSKAKRNDSKRRKEELEERLEEMMKMLMKMWILLLMIK